VHADVECCFVGFFEYHFEVLLTVHSNEVLAIADDEDAKTTGRNRMIYGIIGLVVIIGMWGLVAIVQNTLGIGVGNPPPPIGLPPFYYT